MKTALPESNQGFWQLVHKATTELSAAGSPGTPLEEPGEKAVPEFLQKCLKASLLKAHLKILATQLLLF